MVSYERKSWIVQLTSIGLGENRIQHMAGVTASKQHDIRGFFGSEVPGQTYCRRVSNGVEEICSWPDKRVSHEMKGADGEAQSGTSHILGS